MCVGTADGLVMLSERDGRWDVAATSLPGKHIEDVVVLPNGNLFCGVPEDGAFAAILIILTALVPVMLLSGALSRDREASL